MTKRERELLGRVYDGLTTISSLTPQNPMDIKAVAHNLPIAVKGSGKLAAAVSSIGFGDFDFAVEYLDEAEEILSRRPTGGEQA